MYDPKYMTIEGIALEEIYMRYCSRCTGKQYKDCEFSSYSICKYKENNSMINCDICKKDINTLKDAHHTIPLSNNDGNYIMCDECYKKFIQYIEREEHKNED